MPEEVQDTGTPEASVDTSTSEPLETPSQESQVETPSTAVESTEIPHDNTPINKVGDALKAFDAFKQTERDGGYVKPAAPVKPQQSSRDYTGLNEEDTIMFKNMSTPAFLRLKPMFLEHQTLKDENVQLKSQLEEAGKSSFYENEQAYQVTPEYQALTQNQQLIDVELSHWQEQLANIREGKPWVPIVNGPNGQPVLGEPRPADVRAEGIIVNALTQGHIIKQNLSGKIDTLKTSFGSEHKNFLSKLEDVSSKAFEGADKAVLEKAMQTKLPMFPKHTHSNPVVRGFATALAVIEGMSMMLDEQKAHVTTEKLKTRTMSNAGPSANSINNTPVKKGETVGNALEEFRKAQAMGIA